MWLSGHSRSLKLVPFESLGAVFFIRLGRMMYLYPFVRYLMSKSGVTFKTGLGFI